MSLGGSQTTTQQIDPEIKSRLLSAYDQANTSAGGLMPAYTGQRVAPLNNIQSDAIGNLGQGGQIGWTDVNNAVNATTQALGSTTPMPIQAMSVNRTSADMAGSAPTMPIIQAQANTQGAPAAGLFSYRDVNAPGVAGAQINPGSVGSVSAQTFPGSSLAGYLNPYNQDVFNTSLNQLDVARQRALNGNTDSANLQGGEGAWNGARAGVADALTNEAFGRQASDLASNLNLQGFNTAAGLQQSDAARALTAGMANQQTGFGIANANAGLTQQAGLANAANSLTAQQLNQGADLSRAGTVYGGNLTQGLANQQALNNMGLSNAQLAQNAWQFNGDMLNNRQLFDATQANQIGAANADRNLQAQQLNQYGQLAGNAQLLGGANQLGNLAGAEQNIFLNGNTAALNAGAMAQGQSQAAINAAQQQYLDQQNYPFLQAQLRQMGLGALGGATGGTSTTSKDPGLLGTAGTALMAASLFMSDRRLKTDIRPVGQRSGRDWYAWRYLWDHPSVTRIGVMAQENPDIASEHESGWLQVDYERIAA